MVRKRSVERWLGEEVWKEGKEKKCEKVVKRRREKRWLGEEVHGKRVRRRSEERWLREEVWKV